MTVYIPSNLDFDKLLQRYPMRLVPNKKGPKSDYLAYVVGVVCGEIYKRKNVFTNGDSVPIWSMLLKQHLGSNYNLYVRHLVEAKVLTTNWQFFEGKSRRFFLNKVYLAGFKPYVLTNAKLIRKLEAYYDSQKQYAARKLPYLFKWIDSGKLTIDEERAYKILPEKHSAKLTERKPAGSKRSKEELANIALYCWERNIETIASKNYVDGFTIDQSGAGRLHTALTRTSRSFRKFIKYDGKTLCHVDISNSQPYFASILLSLNFWIEAFLSSRQKERILRSRVITKKDKTKAQTTLFTDLSINSIIKSQINNNNIIYLLTLLRLGESIDNQEFDRYRKSVKTGFFYDDLAVAYSASSKTQKQFTREYIKKSILTVFFSENKILLWEESPHTKLFKKEFPTIGEVFTRIKKEKSNTLALLLQNLESQALLQHVCRLIAQKHPKIPLFTIHDSIVTTVGNQGIIEQIMHQELERFTGLPPTLRVKIWDNTYDE